MESNAMLSWRGGLGITIGCNAFLIASLLDDDIVVWEASSESIVHQQPMKIDQRLHRNMRRTELHRSAYRRVEHPCRQDNRSARSAFDHNNIRTRALLSIKQPHPPPVERVPAVMHLHFLPDMGRMTPQLL
jgi:hypothetical protein